MNAIMKRLIENKGKCMFCFNKCAGEVRGFAACQEHIDSITSGKQVIKARLEPARAKAMPTGATVLNTQKKQTLVDLTPFFEGLEILNPPKRVDGKIAPVSEKVASVKTESELKPA